MKRILIIEDDSSIADLQRDYLLAEGFEVKIASDGNSGLTLALEQSWDLVLLDLMLPGMDGYAVCRRIREEKEVPILMVSARQEDVDKIRGLGLGADDYVTKPFSPSELVARVKAHIRRFERLSNGGGEKKRKEINFRDLRLDLPGCRLYKGEQPVSLTAKELALLELLMSNPDWVYTKEEIFREVWGDDVYGDVSTVTVHIRKLREKIEADPAEPQYIETVWGLGYRMKIGD